MANNSITDIPTDFSFPYDKPYDIQSKFMQALYKTLELKKIGIFESPTGTVRIRRVRLVLPNTK
jgi:hypothetical protein